MRTTTARLEMIEAAERLIAERGAGNVSLREVQKVAGQRNKSAAAYHFGTREGLLAAILEYRMTPINEMRAARLESLGKEGPVTLAGLVRALVDPLVANTVGTASSGYARFLARADADPVFLPIARAAQESTSYRKWRQLTEGQLGHLPKQLRLVRIDRMVATVIQSLALWEDGRGKRGQQLEVLVEDLVETCIGMLSAPPPNPRMTDQGARGRTKPKP